MKISSKAGIIQPGKFPFFYGYIIMVCCFFLIRFSGQVVLTMASRNMIMKWFDKHRGKVNAFSSVSVSLAFSASPLWINELIDAYSWQEAWRIMAYGLVVFMVMIFLFFRDNPEAYGLVPDGRVIKSVYSYQSTSSSSSSAISLLILRNRSITEYLNV